MVLSVLSVVIISVVFIAYREIGAEFARLQERLRAIVDEQAGLEAYSDRNEERISLLERDFDNLQDAVQALKSDRKQE